ncbi:MAG: hypothetical protein KR126chlam6_00170 [Candidatus Anoxychlamydiales bacterium]|nr:hypothetical protein [Candidatus Anoxychlamydiales bacterium]
MSLEEVQKIEGNSGRGNIKFQLANAAVRWQQTLSDANVHLSEDIESKTIEGRNANNSSQTAKFREALPSGIASGAQIAATFALAYFGQKDFLSPASQVISLMNETAKKSFEAKGISSSGSEQYIRIALDQLNQMVSMISKLCSEITNEVTNLNRQTGIM